MWTEVTCGIWLADGLVWSEGSETASLKSLVPRWGMEGRLGSAGSPLSANTGLTRRKIETEMEEEEEGGRGDAGKPLQKAVAEACSWTEVFHQ